MILEPLFPVTPLEQLWKSDFYFNYYYIIKKGKGQPLSLIFFIFFYNSSYSAFTYTIFF